MTPKKGHPIIWKTKAPNSGMTVCMRWCKSNVNPNAEPVSGMGAILVIEAMMTICTMVPLTINGKRTTHNM